MVRKFKYNELSEVAKMKALDDAIMINIVHHNSIVDIPLVILEPILVKCKEHIIKVLNEQEYFKDGTIYKGEKR